MRAQYDPAIDAYCCYFTGVPMQLVARSRRSAEWSHLVPGDEASVVLACKLVNRMQGDLPEEDFRAFVIALARHFEGASFADAAFPDDGRWCSPTSFVRAAGGVRGHVGVDDVRSTPSLLRQPHQQVLGAAAREPTC
jgi:hypothetical protein